MLKARTNAARPDGCFACLGASSRGYAAAAKIKVEGAVVDLDGDEMTRCVFVSTSGVLLCLGGSYR